MSSKRSVSIVEIKVLQALAQQGNLSAKEIHARVGYTWQGVYKILDRLLATGRVNGKATPGAGRGRPAVRYQLTAKGRSESHKIFKEIAR